MIVIPALSSVNDILDTDLILVEHSTGEGFKMTGADLKNFISAQAIDIVARELGEKITNYTVGTGYTFNGTVVKVGKIVFIDGKVINSIHSNSGNILSGIPVNKSGIGKDQNIWWLSSDWTSIAGYSVLSFDNGNNNLAIGIGSAPVGSAQISFSYITD